MIVDGKKRCPKCDTWNPPELFYRSSFHKDGCSSYCKKCQNLRSTSYARENKDKIPTTGYSLKRRYGITSLEYEALLKQQDNKCAICGSAQCSSGRNFAVDHSHESKKVRGLLCSSCNTGLGQFKDDVSLLEKAIRYLNERN